MDFVVFTSGDGVWKHDLKNVFSVSIIVVDDSGRW